MKNPAHQFAEIVRKARLDSGLSLGQVGRMAGISKTHVSDIEQQHDANPTLATMAKLSRVFGIPIANMINGSGYQGIDRGRVEMATDAFLLCMGMQPAKFSKQEILDQINSYDG